MRRAALPVLALLAALPALAGDWNSDAEGAAKRWYQERLKEEKPGLDLESLTPVVLRGPGADLIAPHVRLFDARAVKNRDGVVDWDSRPIAVKRDLKPWRWEGSVEDLRALLAECRLSGADEQGMNNAASVVLAISDGPAFDAARVEISGRTLTYHDHRAAGAFSCGFMGWWHGEATLRFDEAGRLEAFDAQKADMTFEEYREKRKAGDRWFVDEVHDGDSFVKMIEEQEKRRDDVIAELVGQDEAKAAAAEREASRWGSGIDPMLEAAALGASPAAQKRIARVRRWLAPQWAKDADAEARTAYEAQLPAGGEPWDLKEFVSIPLAGAAEPLAGAWRLFRADSLSRTGTQAKHELVLVSKDGTLMAWSREFAQARELLDRAGIRSDGGDGTRRAVAAIEALPHGAFRAARLNAVETERIEVSGRDGIFHLHDMWLGSGVLGAYTQDIEYVFGEDGLLVELRTIGSGKFDVVEMERLLGEADPWMTLSGWVPDEMALKLKRDQAKKEKTPPRHGDRK